MSIEDPELRQRLNAQLSAFDRDVRQLPGIRLPPNRTAFIEQLVESAHRVRYVLLIRRRRLSAVRTDPSSDLFDPLKAAVIHAQRRATDEAFWLVFLSVHFGKNLRTGWRLARDVYGRLGAPEPWSWHETSPNPAAFRAWLRANQEALKGGDGVSRHFGNHRKYTSLNATTAYGTGAAVQTYVEWVRPFGGHRQLMDAAHAACHHDPRQTFAYLYKSMRRVASFGRTAKFDYLTMVGKLGLASLEPGSTFMQGATGPLSGAQLLFGTQSASGATLDSWLADLEARLNLEFGMQILEDALCNWQKSPNEFRPFRG